MPETTAKLCCCGSWYHPEQRDPLVHQLKGFVEDSQLLGLYCFVHSRQPSLSSCHSLCMKHCLILHNLKFPLWGITRHILFVIVLYINVDDEWHCNAWHSNNPRKWKAVRAFGKSEVHDSDKPVHIEAAVVHHQPKKQNQHLLTICSRSWMPGSCTPVVGSRSVVHAPWGWHCLCCQAVCWSCHRIFGPAGLKTQTWSNETWQECKRTQLPGIVQQREVLLWI